MFVRSIWDRFRGQRRRLAFQARLCLLLFALPSAFALAGPSAEEAYRAGDHAAARAAYAERTDRGDFKAQVALGHMLLKGEGGPADEELAIFHFTFACLAGEATALPPLQRLAADGSPAAIYSIGMLLENGDLLPKNFDAAVANYMRAAEAGHATAMNDIGSLYESGEGLPLDYGLAREWYERAARAGSTTALLNLGALFAQGKGVDRDPELAAGLFIVAAKAGSAEAQFNLGRLYGKGEGVELDYVESFVWFKRAEAGGLEMAAPIAAAMAALLTADELREAERRLEEGM